MVWPYHVSLAACCSAPPPPEIGFSGGWALEVQVILL